MKAKQKNLRIFDIEISDDESFYAYMEKNKILLKDFLLLINGDINDGIKKYLKSEGFCYILRSDCHIKIPTKQQNRENHAIISPESGASEAQSKTKHTIVSEHVKTLVINQPVRSGVEISHAGDVTVFARINSAAKVVTEGNLEVYGVIDGLAQCDGDYMIAKNVGKGHIVFNGEILDRDLFDGQLKKITYGKEGAIVKDLFETNHH